MVSPQQPVLQIIKKRKLLWQGHTVQHPQRRRGRPRKMLLHDTKDCLLTATLTQDKTNWRTHAFMHLIDHLGPGIDDDDDNDDDIMMTTMMMRTNREMWQRHTNLYFRLF